MPIDLTQRFLDAYFDLPEHIQRKVDRGLTLLDGSPRHPGMRAKPIRGTTGIFEARVDQDYRMTYERRGDLLVMRNVGPHDSTLKRL